MDRPLLASAAWRSSCSPASGRSQDVEAAMAILMRHATEPIPPVSSIVPDIDPRISDWVARLVEKDRHQRPRSAAAAWDELRGDRARHPRPALAARRAAAAPPGRGRTWWTRPSRRSRSPRSRTRRRRPISRPARSRRTWIRAHARPTRRTKRAGPRRWPFVAAGARWSSWPWPSSCSRSGERRPAGRGARSTASPSNGSFEERHGRLGRRSRATIATRGGRRRARRRHGRARDSPASTATSTRSTTSPTRSSTAPSRAVTTPRARG